MEPKNFPGFLSSIGNKLYTAWTIPLKRVIYAYSGSFQNGFASTNLIRKLQATSTASGCSLCSIQNPTLMMTITSNSAWCGFSTLTAVCITIILQRNLETSELALGCSLSIGASHREASQILKLLSNRKPACCGSYQRNSQSTNTTRRITSPEALSSLFIITKWRR